MAGDAKAVSEFTGDIIAFMKNNLVVAPITQTKEYGRAMGMTLIDITPISAKDAITSNPVNVYCLRPAEEGDPIIPIYICDYQGGNICYQVLSDEADYCFTYAMDGCTFSVGTANGSGDVMVSHANSANLTEDIQGWDTATQQEKQTMMANSLHNSSVQGMLQPDTYRPNGQKVSTTFGVRKNGAWTFHYLSYLVTKKKFPCEYAHHGVHQFV